MDFDEGATAALKALSQRHATSLFVTVLAGWAAVLSRLSGQDDLIIGGAATNAHGVAPPAPADGVRAEAFRVDMSRRPSGAELLQQVKARAPEGGQPDGSRPPSQAFQAVLAWRNEGEPPLDRTERKGLGLFPGADLTLSLSEAGDRIVGELEYAATLFDPETVERHVGYLRLLLGGMVADDAGPVDQLPILSEAESHRLLVEWNATEADYPREKCVHQLFEAQAARTPNAIAVAYDDERLTYAELNAEANRLARHLLGLGVNPDERVAICVERSLDMVVALLGVLKAGCTYVPLDPDYPVERLAGMLDDSAPIAVLTHRPARATLARALAATPQKPPMIDLDAEAAKWAGNDAADIDPVSIGLTPRRLAYIIFTSGSTGRPKGVMTEHGAVVNLLWWLQSQYGLDNRDALLQTAPISFDVSVWEVFWPISAGARLVLARPGGQKNPAYLCETVIREVVTTLHFVPSMLRVFLEQSEARECSSLRRVMSGGEALTPDLASLFFEQLPETRLYNQYGPTETAVDVTAKAVVAGSSMAEIPIGRPISNTRIYILDRYGDPQPTGTIGEIHIGGVPVARGYLGRPDLTAERFIPSRFVPGERLYKTGDLGRYLPNGDLVFVGRNDFQVKIRGFRIELGDCEARLSTHPAVRQALVVAREDAPGDRRLVAYYATRPDAPSPTAEALRAHLSASLPDHMVPAAYVRVKAMPLTSNGKLDRNALPVPNMDAYAARYVPPQGETEEILAQIWADLLRIERVGRSDNFFDLGGHSLLGLRLIARIAKRLNKKLALSTLYHFPTIAELALSLGHSNRARSSFSAAPLDVRQPGTPIFMVHIIEHDLARHLGRGMPVYGLSFGLPAAAATRESAAIPATIGELAKHYVEEMRSVQPRGPYRLIGHSMGGLIAFEMAQQLCEHGEAPDFLGLIDTPKERPPRMPAWKILKNLTVLPPQELAKPIVGLLRKHETLGGARDVLEKNLSRLRAKYRIKPYPGEIHLFKATLPIIHITRESPPQKDFGWRGVALGGLHIHALEGGHMDVVKDPLAVHTAHAIQDALKIDRSSVSLGQTPPD